MWPPVPPARIVTGRTAALATAIILLWPRVSRKVPGPFVALIATTALARLVWRALIDDDGYHRPERTSSAPRSHAPDPFDPTRFPTRLA